MRVFAVLGVICVSLLALEQKAEACGDGPGEDRVLFENPQFSPSTLLTRARLLTNQAVSAEAEAAQADRRARTLLTRARQLQDRALSHEGVELTRLLDSARELALQAQESRAHAGRARQRARLLRAEARELRLQAAEVSVRS